MAKSDETSRVLRAYAEAWLASDLEKVLASYHDEIELHYMGESPLAGTHQGRDAAFTVLAQASTRTARKLIDVEDVLVGEGEHFGFAELAAEIACNLARKFRVCVPRIDVDRICPHRRPPIPIAAW